MMRNEGVRWVRVTKASRSFGGAPWHWRSLVAECKQVLGGVSVASLPEAAGRWPAVGELHAMATPLTTGYV
jgi:hypothetical protein